MKNANNKKSNFYYSDYYDVSPGYSEEKTKIFLSWIGTGKKVLDIGCFDGRESYLIKKQRNEVYGMDKMKSALEQAEKKGIKVFRLDIEKDKWPFDKNFFDIVLAADIIEHLVDTDSFLENVKEILKTDGRLILTTPNLASLGRRLMLLFGKNPYMEVSKYDKIHGFRVAGHLRYFVKDTLYKLLDYHGFVIEEITCERLNLGFITSTKLAKFFPTLGIRFAVLVKVKI